MTTLNNDLEKNEGVFQSYYQPSSLNCPNCPMYTCPYYTASSFSNQAMRSETEGLDEFQASDPDPGYRQRRRRRRRRRRRHFFPIRPFIIRPFFIRPFYPPYMYPYYDYDYDDDNHDDDYDWD
ncbi:hypothetical protein CLHOM_34580 [Clostridium homopropionicum DSM 5847]|uniref:Uncharacterized protein n=1 Tax=Clostridium homopropionicum DSM 5847 TaxID=1121318 RepID=A0A0L6Z6H3_9CLOT|nr:hypothetical protein [Clostridium homopropionicum]KOA18556.1 hypothetical protein CLHOM_34580 [Clostridium homopropionicum DSM 5847]SFF64873.1 hypothetical protein SAMN04488501_10121 [Clostridium homopropionicum]